MARKDSTKSSQKAKKSHKKTSPARKKTASSASSSLKKHRQLTTHTLAIKVILISLILLTIYVVHYGLCSINLCPATAIKSSFTHEQGNNNPAPTPVDDPVSYNDPEGRFNVTLTERTYDLLENPLTMFSVQTEEEIRDEYERLAADDTCTGICQQYLSNPELLDRQFELHRKTTQYSCSMPESFLSSFAQEYTLYSLDNVNIWHTETIDLDGAKTCGIKIIGSHGSEAQLQNVFYQIVFMKGPYIGRIVLPLYPMNTFDFIDEMWKSYGYDVKTGESTGHGYEKELDAFVNFDMDNIVFRKIDSIYSDIIVNTFKITAAQSVASLPEQSPQTLSMYFKDTLFAFAEEERVNTAGGLSAHELLNIFSGLLAVDFIDVRTTQGTYIWEDGVLKQKDAAGNIIDTSQGVITDQGYQTLYNNVTKRNDKVPHTTYDVDALFPLIY